MFNKFILGCLLVFLASIGYSQSDSISFYNSKLKEAEKHLHKNNDSAFYLSKQILQFAIEKNDKKLEAEASKIIGESLFELGNFLQSIEFLIESLAYYQGLNEEKKLAEIYSLLGKVYYYTNNQDKIINHFQKSLTIYKNLNDAKGIAQTYSYIGHYYEKKNEYDKALDFQNKALKIFELIEDTTGIALVYENLGSIYEDQENYTLAKENFVKAFRVYSKLNDDYQLVNILNNIGDFYRKTNNYDSALYFTQKALSLAKENKLNYLSKSAYHDIAKTYILRSKGLDAYIYMDSAYRLLEKIKDTEYSNRSNILNEISKISGLKQEIEIKQQEIQLLSEKEKNKSLKINILLVLSLWLLLTIYLIYRIQQNKIKKGKQNLDEQKSLFETEQKLIKLELERTKITQLNLKSELENKELKEKFLNEQLANKNREIQNHALNMVKKNQLIQELRSAIINIKKSGINNLTELEDLLSTFSESEKDWTEFQKSFEKIHQNFIKILLDKFPELSPSEIRVCSLIKLNLDSREISRMLNISPESYKTIRYRIRKKFKLENEVNLNKFIMDLT